MQRRNQESYLLRNLIDELEALAEEYGDETPVMFAQQPSYPFEYTIARVEVVDLNRPDEDDYRGDDEYVHPEAMEDPDLDDPDMVIYLVEGKQLGSLSGTAREQIGWSGR